MKLLMGFAAILCCYIALGVLLSCSHQAPEAVATKQRAKAAIANEQPAKKPMIVLQFGACKAHR